MMGKNCTSRRQALIEDSNSLLPSPISMECCYLRSFLVEIKCSSEAPDISSRRPYVWHSSREPINTIIRMRLDVKISHGQFSLLPSTKSGSSFQSYYVDLTSRKDGELVFAVES